MTARILIADGASSNRVLLRATLSAARYEVLQATTLDEARALIAEAEPALAIIDADLPGGGGIALCRALDSAETQVRPPVILITAADDARARIEALEAGADEILSRPIDDVTLLARVRAMLRARDTHDALEMRRETALGLGLGFAEPPARYVPPARLAFVAATPARAEAWRDGLTAITRYPVAILGPDEALALDEDAPPPDLYLIDADIHRAGDGLRLLCELRSRPLTRHAAVLVHHARGDGETAAMALDLGANDILAEGFPAGELAIRVRNQLRRKSDAEHLRASVRDGLRLAVTDPLTGLYNRRYALSHLGRVAEQAARTGRAFSVMVADIDRFKAINDTHGHAAGDAVLTAVARCLPDNLRAVDLVSRIGGEEFLVVMPDTEEAEARLAAERLRRVVGGTRVQAERGAPEISVTISIGVATAIPDATGLKESLSALVDRADKALLRAKTEGRNQVTLSRQVA